MKPQAQMSQTNLNAKLAVPKDRSQRASGTGNETAAAATFKQQTLCDHTHTACQPGLFMNPQLKTKIPSWGRRDSALNWITERKRNGLAADVSPIVVAHLARSSANPRVARVCRTIERAALTTPSDTPALHK